MKLASKSPMVSSEMLMKQLWKKEAFLRRSQKFIPFHAPT